VTKSFKQQHPGSRKTSNLKFQGFGPLSLGFSWSLVLGIWSFFCSLPLETAAAPPPGFIALFNGEDLSGWRGGDTFDHRKLLAMPAAKRDEQIAKWTALMKPH